MLGQAKLVAQIDDLIAKEKFPRFSIVVGERGMEHEDVGRVVAQRLGCPYILLQDVKVDTIRSMIVDAYKLHGEMVYIIPHADDMSINAKNAMLKVVEDAPNKAYFIMCLEDLSNTLATIQSRGIVFRMCHPGTDTIKEFAEELYVNKSDIKPDVIEKIASVCSTAGDVIYFTHHDINNFYAYAEYVADNLCKVDSAEIFKFSDMLAVKDEEEKFDVRLFLKTLQNVYMRRCISPVKWGCSENCSCEMSRCIGRYMQDLKIKGINKTMLLDNLWLEMRKIWKSQM